MRPRIPPSRAPRLRLYLGHDMIDQWVGQRAFRYSRVDKGSHVYLHMIAWLEVYTGFQRMYMCFTVERDNQCREGSDRHESTFTMYSTTLLASANSCQDLTEYNTPSLFDQSSGQYSYISLQVQNSGKAFSRPWKLRKPCWYYILTWEPKSGSTA